MEVEEVVEVDCNPPSANYGTQDEEITQLKSIIVQQLKEIGELKKMKDKTGLLETNLALVLKNSTLKDKLNRLRYELHQIRKELKKRNIKLDISLDNIKKFLEILIVEEKLEEMEAPISAGEDGHQVNTAKPNTGGAEDNKCDTHVVGATQEKGTGVTTRPKKEIYMLPVLLETQEVTHAL